MAAERGKESTSKQWLQMIDQGGLFKINNDTFVFFVEMEMNSQHQLINL